MGSLIRRSAHNNVRCNMLFSNRDHYCMVFEFDAARLGSRFVLIATPDVDLSLSLHLQLSETPLSSQCSVFAVLISIRLVKSLSALQSIFENVRQLAHNITAHHASISNRTFLNRSQTQNAFVIITAIDNPP